MSSHILGSAPPPDPREDPPLHLETRRSLWVSFGVELLLIALTYWVGGSFLPFMALYIGMAIIAYGLRPGLFSAHREAQIIQGTPYSRRASILRWVIAGALCMAASLVSSRMYRHFVPNRPNLVQEILVGVRAIIRDENTKSGVFRNDEQGSNGPGSTAPPKRKWPSTPPETDYIEVEMMQVANDAFQIVAGKRISFNVYFAVKGPPVKFLHGVFSLRVGRAADEHILAQQFQREVAKAKTSRVRGIELGGAGLYRSAITDPLSSDDAAGLLAGTKFLYLQYWMDWTGSSANYGSLRRCERQFSPLTADLRGTQLDFVTCEIIK